MGIQVCLKVGPTPSNGEMITKKQIKARANFIQTWHK